MVLKVVELTKPEHIKQFHKVATHIYRLDPNWVEPLHSQIENIFDPAKNPHFKTGHAKRWLLYNEPGQPIGRIAAFHYHNGIEKTAGIGFFECENNQEAANTLFDAAFNWLRSADVEFVDGPVNFGDNDTFWGLLIDGFTPPAWGMAYNPPYYQELFESYGFQEYYRQQSNHLDLQKPFPKRLYKVSEYVIQKGAFRFVPFSYKQIDTFLDDFATIHKKAWQFHENYKELDLVELKGKFMALKPLVIEEFNWFAYKDNEPVGLIIMVPDLNQIFKNMHGKVSILNLLGLKLFGVKKKMNRARIIAMGVVPEYQQKGVEAGFFYYMHQMIQKYPWYKEVELSWIGTFNPKMQALLKAFGSFPAKYYLTYRRHVNGKEKVTPLSEIPVDTKFSN